MGIDGWSKCSLEFLEHPDPMAYLDRDFYVVVPNQSFLDLVGAESAGEVSGSICLFSDEEDVRRRVLNSNKYPVNYVTTIDTVGGGEVDVSVLFKHVSVCEKEYLARFRDISEKKDVEKREELLRSMLTHDVRNHNQVVLGYLELMKEDDDVSCDERLDKVIESVESSLETIDKVQKLASRLENDRVKSKSLNVVSEYVDDAIDQNRRLLENNNINIVYNPINEHSDGFCFLVDHFLVDVVSNLIENAVRHAECSKIRVSMDLDGDMLEIIVEDDGKGISCEEPSRIFDLDYTERTESAGIGLHLVKKIIDSYGGDISVGSSDYNGARFSIKLKPC